MKLETAKLVKAMSLPMQIIGGRLAKTNRLMIAGKSGQFSIEAQGDNQFCRVVIDGEGDIEPAQLSPTMFNSVIHHMEEQLTLTMVENGRMVCASGNRKSNIPTFSDRVDLFVPAGAPTVLPPEVLAAGIKTAKLYVAPDNHRQILKSVHVVCSETHIMVESSTGASFSHYKAPAICGPCDFLIPSEFADTVHGALNKNSQVFLSENMLTIRNGDSYYSCKLMEGQFVNTAPILELECNPIGMISRRELVDAYEAMRALRGDGEDQLVKSKITFHPSSCMVESFGDNPYSQMIEGKFKAAELLLNGLTFLKCISLFPEDATLEIGAMDFNGQNAVSVKDGFLRVMSSQIRG